MSEFKFEALRVVIVDPDPIRSRAEMIRSVLMLFNVSMIRDANDVERLFVRLKEFPADLAITALAPGATAALARAVRRNPASPNPALPIIAVSDPMSPQELVRVRDAGVTEVLVHPITAKALAARVEQAMQRPRPFVKEAGFVGPDRRRRAPDGYKGPDRRKKD
jgi:AmiR/NasT family two-component response regulator